MISTKALFYLVISVGIVFIFAFLVLALNPLNTPNMSSPTPIFVEFVKKPIPSVNISDLETRIFKLTNEKRNQSGLESLEWSENLAKTARFQSECMAKYNFFQHESSMCGTLSSRLKANSIISKLVAENIFKQPNVDKYIDTYDEDKLIASKPNHIYYINELADYIADDVVGLQEHRKNVLHRGSGLIGVGVSLSSDGYYFVTQNFIYSVDSGECGKLGQPCCWTTNTTDLKEYYCYDYYCNVGLNVCGWETN